jgi:hypothetical protein
MHPPSRSKPGEVVPSLIGVDREPDDDDDDDDDDDVESAANASTAAAAVSTPLQSSTSATPSSDLIRDGIRQIWRQL